MSGSRQCDGGTTKGTLFHQTLKKRGDLLGVGVAVITDTPSVAAVFEPSLVAAALYQQPHTVQLSRTQILCCGVDSCARATSQVLCWPMGSVPGMQTELTRGKLHSLCVTGVTITARGTHNTQHKTQNTVSCTGASNTPPVASSAAATRRGSSNALQGQRRASAQRGLDRLAIAAWREAQLVSAARREVFAGSVSRAARGGRCGMRVREMCPTRERCTCWRALDLPSACLT